MDNTSETGDDSVEETPPPSGLPNSAASEAAKLRTQGLGNQSFKPRSFGK